MRFFEIYAAGKHVPAIERCIKTIKDRCLCMCHLVPFKRYTKLMIIHLVITCVKWLKRFPIDGGISKTLSPENILDGTGNPDLSIKRITLGAYALAFVNSDNNMNSMSVPALSLSESNTTEGNYFMSLFIGKNFHSNQWEELPFDQQCIKLVDSFANEETQHLLHKGNVTFGWSISDCIDYDNIE